MRSIPTLVAVVGIAALSGHAAAASFPEIDADGNGAVTPAEFAKAYPDAVKEDWVAVDANGDGEISEDEYTAAEESDLLPAKG